MPVIDRALASLITVKLVNEAQHGYLEGWAWTYLTACLATSCGYELARAVVEQVQEDLTPEREAA